MSDNLIFLGFGVIVGVVLAFPAAVALVRAAQKKATPPVHSTPKRSWLDQPV